VSNNLAVTNNTKSRDRAIRASGSLDRSKRGFVKAQSQKGLDLRGFDLDCIVGWLLSLILPALREGACPSHQLKHDVVLRVLGLRGTIGAGVLSIEDWL
jgi:hypothetical protein